MCAFGNSTGALKGYKVMNEDYGMGYGTAFEEPPTDYSSGYDINYDDEDCCNMGYHIGTDNTHNEGYGMPGFDKNGEVKMDNLTEGELEDWEEIMEMKRNEECGDENDISDLDDLTDLNDWLEDIGE